jgi:hypothetical protein
VENPFKKKLALRRSSGLLESGATGESRASMIEG